MVGRRSPRVTRIASLVIWITRPPVSFCTLAGVQTESGANPGTASAGVATLALPPLVLSPDCGSGDWTWRTGPLTMIRAWAAPMTRGTDSAMLMSLVASRVMPLVSTSTGRPTIATISALRHL